jgi:hypothetical protein
MIICCCLSAAEGASVTTKPPKPGLPFRVTIGAVDTIGGTTYDMQVLGPAWRMLVNSADRGIYAVWMYSHSLTGTIFPDRNMRCNYYDCASQSWQYSDSAAFMGRGLTVFSTRSGYGGIDADTSGTPFFSCHTDIGGQIRPLAARGCSGDFSDASLPPCQWPPVAVGQNGAVHVLAATTSLDLTYCHIAPDAWPHWSTPLTGMSPSPGYPTQNIAASKVSDKVSLVWENETSGQAYRMQSTNGGSTWSSTYTLVPPDAYGGDTGTVFFITSLFPFYDRHDRLHIVADLTPQVGGSALVVPAQIWHWCPNNNPEWSRIHMASCSPAHMRADVGYNARYACRPSIGEGGDGRLYVAWEQFDSLNFEPSTNRLRADIFYTRDSGDNGATWQPGMRITDQGTWSCRFPSAIDYFAGDTFRVSYMVDQQAGYSAWGMLPEGVATENPIVVHKVSVNVGITDGGDANVPSIGLTIAPNPLRRTSTISYYLRRAAPVTITLRDVTGRYVRRLPGGLQPAGRHAIEWDGTDDGGRALPTGVYFCRMQAGRMADSRRVALVR